MASLLRRLFPRRRPDGAGAVAFYAEAELSGWMPMPPEAGKARDTSSTGYPAEIDGLLARFYSSQEC
jgi:hypothetical protein